MVAAFAYERLWDSGVVSSENRDGKIENGLSILDGVNDGDRVDDSYLRTRRKLGRRVYRNRDTH